MDDDCKHGLAVSTCHVCKQRDPTASRPGLGQRGDNRPVILDAAQIGGWHHDEAFYDGDDIIRDRFSAAHLGVVRVVWLRNPFGRTKFAGAYYTPKNGKTETIWTLGGKKDLRDLLRTGVLSE